jgi:hypothetical protein
MVLVLVYAEIRLKTAPACQPVTAFYNTRIFFNAVLDA